MNIRPLESLTKQELIERVKQDHIPDAGKMVPEGFKLVPVEPTYEMLKEIHINEHFTRTAMDARYKAMLAAAPQPDHIPDATKMVGPTDTEMLDWIENNARIDPDMSGNHTYWPTSFGKQIRGRNLRDAITKAMRGEE